MLSTCTCTCISLCCVSLFVVAHVKSRYDVYDLMNQCSILTSHDFTPAMIYMNHHTVQIEEVLSVDAYSYYNQSNVSYMYTVKVQHNGGIASYRYRPSTRKFNT